MARISLLFVLTGVIALVATQAWAVHDAGIVELDHNMNNDATAGTDWNSLYDASGNRITANEPASVIDSTGVLRDFTPGATGPDSTYYDPSTKDFQAIGSSGSQVWQCQQATNPTDKDEILNAYAIAARPTGALDPYNGHTLLYFGAERFDNSGAAFMGFWFFQKKVGCTSPASGDAFFTGSKTDGDVLVQINFTNGGAITRLQAFEWLSTPSPHLNLIADSADCDTASAGDDLCASVNTTNQTPNWQTQDKTKPTDSGTNPTQVLDPSEFVEGGLDLKDIFANIGGVPPCFGSFLAETRSTHSQDGTLKDWVGSSFNTCKGKISISPNGVNQIGASHTFTVHVEADDGTGNGFQPQSGVKPTVTLTNTGGATASITGGTCSTTGTNSSGDCTVVVSSPTAGTTTAHAAATLTVGTSSLSVETDGKAPNSGDATKKWVDGNISITPNGVNEVGHQHVFTITANAVPAGTTVTFNSITPSVSPAPTSQSTTCASPSGTGNTRTCTLTINNSSAGTFTANATVSLTFSDGTNSTTFTRSTDSTHGSSGSATKTFVDAKVSITPSATNEVGHSHTFTVTVQKNAGDGAGFVAATVGNVDVTLTNSNGATNTLNAAASTCDDAQPSGDNLDANGQCTVVFTSNSAGQVTGHASVSLSVGGVALTRSTD
ncbi:MAG: hypothetical protein ACJ77A_03785, partial [Actinomycetota bacterium]